MSRPTGASNPLMTMDKRSKIMVAVLAVVVVIAALYFLVLKKSGSSDNGANAPVATHSSTSSVAPKASPTPKATVAPTPASVVIADSTRDPFVPLPQESTASAAPSAAPSSSPTSSSSSSAPASSHSLQVLSISGANASVSYDKGSAKTVHQGSTIATGMTVVRVDPDAVFVSVGNKVYALAAGQTVDF